MLGNVPYVEHLGLISYESKFTNTSYTNASCYGYSPLSNWDIHPNIQKAPTLFASTAYWCLVSKLWPASHPFVFVKESLNRLFVVLLFLQSRIGFVYYYTIWTVQMRHLSDSHIVTESRRFPHRMLQMWLEGAERSCSFLGHHAETVVWVNNCDTPQKTFQKETQYCQFTRTTNILHNFATLHPISRFIRVFNLDPNSGDTAFSTGVMVGTQSSTSITKQPHSMVPRCFIPYIHHGDAGGFLMWGDGTNCI